MSFSGVNVDGVGNLNGILPPDTDGDVGPNHYFQMINLSFAIYDKNGSVYTYSIKSFITNTTIADTKFLFKKSDYPSDVEIVDMR